MDTTIQRYWIQILRAATDINQSRPADAINVLRNANLYDLSGETSYSLPLYLRGQAYLNAGQAASAALEFQNLVDHPGLTITFETGSLAHLQLGRAYAMMGDKTKAKAAYQDFLTLWKDADPDIPIYKQAKAEYAKLQ